MSQDLITNLYNSFDPDKALPAGDAAYVDLLKSLVKSEFQDYLPNSVNQT